MNNLRATTLFLILFLFITQSCQNPPPPPPPVPGTAWGIAPYDTDTDYGRIYQWNKVKEAWDEPTGTSGTINSSGRANQISVGMQSVWALGTLESSGRRIFKWEPVDANWNEPNPQADNRAIQISALNDQFAWAIVGDNKIKMTDDYGNNWKSITPEAGLKQISVGSGAYEVWGIDLNNQLFKYDLASNSWKFLHKDCVQVSADRSKPNQAWVLMNSQNSGPPYDIYFGTFNSSGAFTPKKIKSTAQAVKIAGMNERDAWVIGNGNRVFFTGNFGESWYEMPTPDTEHPAHAQLVDISADN